MGVHARARFRLLPVDRDAAGVEALTTALTRLFGGTEDEVLVPAGPDEDLTALRADLELRATRLPEQVRLLVRTSGSTRGRGRLVGLTAGQLRASARATDERLGGPGSWVLALPPHHIAGLQVLARSLLAGRAPVLLEDGFDTGRLARALARARRDDPAARVHLSLVPTQLADTLADQRARAELARTTTVLVGGDATPALLCEQARQAGVPLRLSYGMSETCGGCVYDGLPLRGVRVLLGDRLDRPGDHGRIWLSGPMVMSGYLDADPGVTVRGDARWIATSDLGHWHDGRLVVDGRIDDVIITGGLKVGAVDVRDAVLAGRFAADAAVVGLPHPRWGQVVTAVVVPSTPGWDPERAEELRAETGRLIGRERAPRVVVAVDELPRLASGKLDRLAATEIAERARRQGRAWTADPTGA